jgi:integrase/recombinase XerD
MRALNAQIMKVTSKIVYDHRRSASSEGKPLPFKLRVTFQRRSLEFQTIYSLIPEDQQKLSAPNIKENLRQIRAGLEKCCNDAQTYFESVGDHFAWILFTRDFINRHPAFIKRKIRENSVIAESKEFDFTPYEKRFKSVFQQVHPGKDYISYVFEIYIRKLIRRKKMGSALNYQYAYNDLKKFDGNVKFETVTEDWLYDYEDWKTNVEGCSITTVAINLRALRAVFNEAASKKLKIINKEHCYPFGKREYQIPSTRNTKVALLKDELKLIYEFNAPTVEIAEAVDYWWFLYFGNGMNLKDAAMLKYKDEHEEFLVFRRAKTSRTGGSTLLPIMVHKNGDIKAILSRRANTKVDDETYVFPILSPGMNPLEIHDTIKKFLRFVNSNMRIVFNTLGIEKKSSTKVTRHSFMTQQKRNGASTEEIQEAVGHSNPMTTQFYLDSFELDAKKSFAQNAEKFKS